MKRSFFHELASFFALYAVVFIPFPFFLTSIQYDLTEMIFGKLIGVVSSGVFGKSLDSNSIYSDSTSMYILVLLLFVLSLITAILLRQWNRWQINRLKVIGVIYTLCTCYLALQLLKYGVDKLFKNQFYLPEPNTLYTRVGDLDKDILYWSSMGTSHFYNVFMGAIETIAALFLLFRKTRLIGLLMSIAILLNVVAVNFAFDIGVKLFSLFLLFLNLYLAAPYLERFYLLLKQQPVLVSQPVRRTLTMQLLKWFVVGLILLETLVPFIRSRNFNDDLASRPYLHGAYEVKQMIEGADTLAAHAFPVKRLFIHRDNYLVFQDQQDQMQDYKLSYDASRSSYMLTDYQLRQIPVDISYNKKDSVLMINYSRNAQPVRISAHATDWRKLPALRKGFHWTVD